MSAPPAPPLSVPLVPCSLICKATGKKSSQSSRKRYGIQMRDNPARSARELVIKLTITHKPTRVYTRSHRPVLLRPSLNRQTLISRGMTLLTSSELKLSTFPSVGRTQVPLLPTFPVALSSIITSVARLARLYESSRRQQLNCGRVTVSSTTTATRTGTDAHFKHEHLLPSQGKLFKFVHVTAIINNSRRYVAKKDYLSEYRLASR